MKSTPITIYSHVAYVDEEYIDIEADGSPLDLSVYDLQMQIVKAVEGEDEYTFLLTPAVTKDSATTGRCWPSLTAAQTAALRGENPLWGLLLRPSDLSWDHRLIGFGRVNVERGLAWR